MKTREAVSDAMKDMRKAFDKVAKCIDQASRLSDPASNAELMRSLHSAQDALGAARRALTQAQSIAGAFGAKLLTLLPSAEEAQVA